MNDATMGFRNLFAHKHLDRKVHGFLTIAWFLLAIPAVLFWRESVPFLVYVSVYANFVGHWSSYQAAKAEKKIEDAVHEANGEQTVAAGA
jgi:hypothetical protein